MSTVHDNEGSPLPSKRRFAVHVEVFPRREILDPQGKAIGDALQRLGYGSVREVRAGKSFTLLLDAANDEAANQSAREICERLLANPIVEDFSFTVRERLPVEEQGGAA
jgi:phosphoribosylformylglycinamidine synthase